MYISLEFMLVVQIQSKEVHFDCRLSLDVLPFYKSSITKTTVLKLLSSLQVKLVSVWFVLIIENAALFAPKMIDEKLLLCKICDVGLRVCLWILKFTVLMLREHFHFEPIAFAMAFPSNPPTEKFLRSLFLYHS